MRTKKKDKPTAESLTVLVRVALAQGWHTLDALSLLAGRATGARLRVHAALGELRAAGVALEERVERGVAEVRELPPVEGPDHPTLREPSPPVEGEPVDAASYYLGRGRDAEDDDAPAPPVDRAAPVEAAEGAAMGAREPMTLVEAAAIVSAEIERAARERPPPAYNIDCPKCGAIHLSNGCPLDATPPKGPGPSSRCAVCGEQYRHHATNSTPNPHPFAPKLRGRPRVAPPSAAIDAPPTAADVLAEIGTPLSRERLDAVRAWAGEGAAEPETSSGDSQPSTPPRCPSVWRDVRCEREAGHPCDSDAEPGRHHDTADRDAMWTNEAAERWAKRAPVVAPPRCRPPACHRDAIHVPGGVRGFALPLCEACRAWVEGAGGTLAAGGLAGAFAQARTPSTPSTPIRAFCRVDYTAGPLVPCSHDGPRAQHPGGGELGGHIVYLDATIIPPRGDGVVVYTPIDEPWDVEAMRAEIVAAASEASEATV